MTVTPQRAPPEVGHVVAEHSKCSSIGRHCVIVEVAGHDLPQASRCDAACQCGSHRLDARLAEAQRAGDLKFFNRAYRHYRLDRAASGERAMSYAAARSPLKRTLTSLTAGKVPAGIITQIFDGE